MNNWIRMGAPDVGKQEAKEVYEQVLSGWISQGKRTQDFEKKISDFINVNYSIAMSNGTVTLHSTLVSLGISPGDYVVVPSLTYISSVNVIYLCGAIPIYCDVDQETLLLDLEELENILEKYSPKAVMSVDLKGLPCDYDLINQICDVYGAVHIADSAESLGGIYKGSKVGSQAVMHSFSLFANKTITTGEGGIVTTNSEDYASKLKIIRNQGQGDIRYEHISMGFNYRFTDVKASIGITQVSRLDDILSKRQKVVKNIKDLMGEKVKFQKVPKYVDLHPYYNLTCLFESKKTRDSIMNILEKNNIETRISFPPCHLQPYHKNLESISLNNLDKTVRSFEIMLDIPCHQNINENEIDKITSIILANV